MIKILKKLRKEKGLYLIVTELDAKAADINTEHEKNVIDHYLEEHLVELGDHVDDDTVIKRFKNFLIESVFTHYVDMVGILNYICIMRDLIKVAKKHPSHSKFLFVMEFKNYIGDKSDDETPQDNDDKPNDTGVFFGLDFNTDFLDKKDLSKMEGVLMHGFNSLYEGNILVVKPKEVKMHLKKKETPEGVEEFLQTDVSFYKQDK